MNFYIGLYSTFDFWDILFFGQLRASVLGFPFKPMGEWLAKFACPMQTRPQNVARHDRKNALKCKLKPAHKTVQDDRICWKLFWPQTFLLFHSRPRSYYIFNVIFDSVHAASLSFHWQRKKVKTVSAPCKTRCVGWNCKALLLILLTGQLDMITRGCLNSRLNNFETKLPSFVLGFHFSGKIAFHENKLGYEAQ